MNGDQSDSGRNKKDPHEDGGSGSGAGGLIPDFVDWYAANRVSKKFSYINKSVVVWMTYPVAVLNTESKSPIQ